MTIAAGFKTNDGIVICADTQETLAGYSKRNVPKLEYSPAGPRWYEGGEKIQRGAVAFCGATDNGPFVDNLVHRCLSASYDGGTILETCRLIKAEIEATYTEAGQIFQPGLCPNAELIYGVAQDGESLLFTADGPVVNEVERFASRGIGAHLANFIVERMFSLDLSLYQAFILASYTLAQVKEHVQGCGGESHVAILSDGPRCGLVHPDRVRAVERMVGAVDAAAAGLVIKSADAGAPSEAKSSEHLFRLLVKAAHDAFRREISNLNEGTTLSEVLGGVKPSPRDEFGFPTTPPAGGDAGISTD